MFLQHVAMHAELHGIHMLKIFPSIHFFPTINSIARARGEVAQVGSGVAPHSLGLARHIRFYVKLHRPRCKKAVKTESSSVVILVLECLANSCRTRCRYRLICDFPRPSVWASTHSSKHGSGEARRDMQLNVEPKLNQAHCSPRDTAYSGT
jgi:hypothetical protein